MTLAQVQEWMIARLRAFEAAARQRKDGCFMRRKEKPITRALIRKYFGKNASIWDFGGWYRVTTPGGGLVRIGPGERARLVYGGDEVYRALMGLLGECWGVVKAGGLGSREVLLGAIAHGEALGVNVQPDFRDRWATFARWCVALGIIVASIAMKLDTTDTGAFLTLLVAVAVFFLMKRKARREEQYKLETGGFHYPRGTTGASFADEDEDELRKGGLI
jgi:hypothetical protein